MRRISGMLALAAGAALVVGSTGAVVGQEEGSATEAAEPSTLSIHQISSDLSAREPLAGKAYDKAIAKAAPNAVRYLVASMGADDIERIVELSLAARAMEDAGEAAAAEALIDLATLIYRASWTAAKSDPVTLNSGLEGFIAGGDYAVQDPALALWSDGETGVPGFYDLCLEPDDTWTQHDPAEPSRCANENGRQVRASSEPAWANREPLEQRMANTPSANELFNGLVPDKGGLGIHKVVQDKSADDKLAGKQYQKALAKTLKKRGPAIAKAYATGSDGVVERGVIEMVLMAREADEAGNKKAAKAFMDLASAAYRSAVPEWTKTALLNQSLILLADEEYAGVSGLELSAPEGMEDACFDSTGAFMFGTDYNTHWECEASGGRVTRMPIEEVDKLR